MTSATEDRQLHLEELVSFGHTAKHTTGNMVMLTALSPAAQRGRLSAQRESID